MPKLCVVSEGVVQVSGYLLFGTKQWFECLQRNRRRKIIKMTHQQEGKQKKAKQSCGIHVETWTGEFTTTRVEGHFYRFINLEVFVETSKVCGLQWEDLSSITRRTWVCLRYPCAEVHWSHMRGPSKQQSNQSLKIRVQIHIQGQIQGRPRRNVSNRVTLCNMIQLTSMAYSGFCSWLYIV